MKIQIIKSYPFQVSNQQNVIQLTYLTFAGQKTLNRIGIQVQGYRRIRSSQQEHMIILICLDERILEDNDTIYVPENVLYNLRFPKEVKIQCIYPPISIEEQQNSVVVPVLPIAKQLVMADCEDINEGFLTQIISKGPFIIQAKGTYLVDPLWIINHIKNASWKTSLILNKHLAINNKKQQTKQQKNYILITIESRGQLQMFRPHQTTLKVKKTTSYQPLIYSSIIVKGIHNKIYQKQAYVQLWNKIQQKIGQNKIITLQCQMGNGMSCFIQKRSYEECLIFKIVDLSQYWSLNAVYSMISNLYKSGCHIVYVKNVKWLCELGLNNPNNQSQQNILSTCLKKIQQFFEQGSYKTLRKMLLIINYTSDVEIKEEFNNNFNIKFQLTKQEKEDYARQVLKYFPNLQTNDFKDELQMIFQISLDLGWFRLHQILTTYHTQNMHKNNQKDYFSGLVKAIQLKTNQQKQKNVAKISWNDIGGLETAKEEIIDTILLPIKHPQIFDEWIRPRTGLLFYGPPGTGKTLLGKCIANQCKMSFISVKGPQLLNMYVGESEKNVREVFERAAKSSPCIIFMDELDALVPKRGNSSDSNQVMDRIVAELMTQMDLASQNRVFIIGATNRPDLLDPSVLRAGRFDKQIYLGISKKTEERVKILEAQTRNIKLEKNFNYEKIVEALPKNLTGADFYGLTSKAVMRAMDRIIDQHQESLQENPLPQQIVILEEDFMKCAPQIIPSVTQKELNHYQSLKTKYSSS